MLTKNKIKTVFRLQNFLLFNLIVLISINLRAETVSNNVKQEVEKKFKEYHHLNEHDFLLGTPWYCSDKILLQNNPSNSEVINFIRNHFEVDPQIKGHYIFQRNGNTLLNEVDEGKRIKEFKIKGTIISNIHTENNHKILNTIRFKNGRLYILAKRSPSLRIFPDPFTNPIGVESYEWQVCESKIQIEHYLEVNGCTPKEIESIFNNPQKAKNFCQSDKTTTDQARESK